MTWGITLVSTLAASYLYASSHRAAGATELAAPNYSCLPLSLPFQLIVLETLDPLASYAADFYVSRVGV